MKGENCCSKKRVFGKHGTFEIQGKNEFLIIAAFSITRNIVHKSFPHEVMYCKYCNLLFSVKLSLLTITPQRALSKF